MFIFSKQAPELNRRQRAIVIGGSMAGLLAARVLLNHFEQVILVERDRFPTQPEPRVGVPQSSHVHVLLTQGQRLLEQLFPGLAAELTAAGAPTVDWLADWLMLGAWGWHLRCPSPLHGRTCTRMLLEYQIRQRLLAYPQFTILAGCQVDGLLSSTDRTRITGVKLHWREPLPEPFALNPDNPDALMADFVVDASGRNSALPDWLVALGYAAPEETVINSFLGYASRWYQRPATLQADWQGITIAAQPGVTGRGGVLYPIEGDRWIVTLGGVGRDYPPTDEAGFLEFARSLRHPILYEVLKDAQPLSPIYSYRRTENRLRHYEQLTRMPAGVVAIGDAVCAFNPVYGQGMTTAALGVMTLDRCLKEQRSQGKTAKFCRQFQQRLAHIVEAPWMMATGEDRRWSTTQGVTGSQTAAWVQAYVDRVIRLSVSDPQIMQTFAEVVHMIKTPAALFQPNVLIPVLASHFQKLPPSETANQTILNASVL
jgi:2-polyprenyl-6-methoxyphenol hydroxylase-like FAD-dependent oxidoreductase